MIVLFYALGAVIMMTHRAQCELSSDTVYRLLSARLDDLVFDMKTKDKTLTNQIEDFMATVTTTNQRLESIEKRLSDVSANNKQHGEQLVSFERRLNDLASCNQTVATFEKRLGNLEKHLKDVATAEVGRRLKLLTSGLKQEKAATQLRFDGIKGAIDAQISDTKVQLFKVKQDFAGIAHNTSKVLENIQITMKNVTSETEVVTKIARTTKVEVTTALQNTHNLISRVDAVERTQGDLKSKTNAIGTLVDATRGQISQLERKSGTFSGFSVARSYDSTYGQWQIMTFDRVLSNLGNHYNTSTGFYTVPVSGVYVFMFNVAVSSPALSDGTTPAAHVCLRVDSHCIRAFAQGPNMTGGNAAVLDVKAGDQVFISTVGGIRTYFIRAYETTFSGALLHVK